MSTMDLMIDLETLSTRPDGVIVQIGAAFFDPEARNDEGVTSTKQIDIDPQSGIDLGRHIEWQTLAWWMQQSDDARFALVIPEMSDEAPGQETALRVFADWATGQPWEIGCVWALGAAFDLAMLEHAMKQSGVRVPWSHRDQRCIRTLRPLCPEVERVEPKVAHRAEDDAIAQAIWVQRLLAARLSPESEI